MWNTTNCFWLFWGIKWVVGIACSWLFLLQSLVHQESVCNGCLLPVLFHKSFVACIWDLFGWLFNDVCWQLWCQVWLWAGLIGGHNFGLFSVCWLATPTINVPHMHCVTSKTMGYFKIWHIVGLHWQLCQWDLDQGHLTACDLGVLRWSISWVEISSQWFQVFPPLNHEVAEALDHWDGIGLYSSCLCVPGGWGGLVSK